MTHRPCSTRRALLGATLAVPALVALGACGNDEPEDEPTLEVSEANITSPRGLIENGQKSVSDASEVAQFVSERLVVRDGADLDQVVENLTERSILAEDADVTLSAQGLESVVQETFAAGQVFTLIEPSKVGRYGKLPDTKTVVERSVSLVAEGVDPEEAEHLEPVAYVTSLYVVLAKSDDQWRATAVRALSFGRR